MGTWSYNNGFHDNLFTFFVGHILFNGYKYAKCFQIFPVFQSFYASDITVWAAFYVLCHYMWLLQMSVCALVDFKMYISEYARQI